MVANIVTVFSAFLAGLLPGLFRGLQNFSVEKFVVAQVFLWNWRRVWYTRQITCGIVELFSQIHQTTLNISTDNIGIMSFIISFRLSRSSKQSSHYLNILILSCSKTCGFINICCLYFKSNDGCQNLYTFGLKGYMFTHGSCRIAN